MTIRTKDLPLSIRKTLVKPEKKAKLTYFIDGKKASGLEYRFNDMLLKLQAVGIIWTIEFHPKPWKYLSHKYTPDFLISWGFCGVQKFAWIETKGRFKGEGRIRLQLASETYPDREIWLVEWSRAVKSWTWRRVDKGIIERGIDYRSTAKTRARLTTAPWEAR